VAGVVREIDALSFVGFAASPLNLHAADTTSDGSEQAGDGMNAGAHELANFEVKWCSQTKER